MAVDTTYRSLPYVYKSIGLYARWALDQCPENAYLDMLNCLERGENEMSSRFGTQIINRDPLGVGLGQNYFFTSPVTTLARLNFQGNSWRYAALGDGSLYRRAGNTQGAYSQIAPLDTFSGNPFSSVITNCFETAQPFIFFYDSEAALKDTGVLSPLQLTGIDPPPQTANTYPYSPLLVLIEPFSLHSSLTTSGVSSWAFADIQTLTATSGQTVTDFSEFFGVTGGGGGGGGGGGTVFRPSTGPPVSAGVSQSGGGTRTATSSAMSGFPSFAPGSSGISLTVQLSATFSVFEGGGAAIVQVSPDGINWYNWFSASSTTPPEYHTASLPFAVSNIAVVQVRLFLTATAGPGGVVSINAAISDCYITSGGGGGGGGGSTFGAIINGMLSNLNTNTSINIPIAQVVASNLVNGVYTQLSVTTAAPHGLSSGAQIALYWTSNSLVNGFYTINVSGPNTFTVPYSTTNPISAMGGFVVGGASAPAYAVVAYEYTTPYPSQFSMFGFYQQVPTNTASFPFGAWSGTVAASTTGTISNSITLDLSQNNQITDDDLIVLTLAVSEPNNIDEITLQFNVGSNSGSSFYQKAISPAYYQPNIAGDETAYQATQAQILADTLGLLTGAPPNSTTAQLQPSNIGTGPGSWVTCYLRRGDFLPVGNAGAAGLDWSNVSGWELAITTNSTGGATISVNGLYLQGGSGPSSYGGVGYNYRYTFYDAATGTESSPCPIQTFNTQYGFLASLTPPIVLRQAFQIVGFYSTDQQVTHIRMYRQGGTFSDNWYRIDQIPVSGQAGQFFYKDVIPDALLAQAIPLELDNDPPVTSSLVNPINTTMANQTTGPGQTPFSTFFQQTIVASDPTVQFVANQIVIIGNADNLEELMVLVGGTGSFNAIPRLQHNAGEPITAYSVPRVMCNLAAIAYDQTWLAGDPNNPHYLYRSKKNRPENFSPAAYTPVGTPDDPITAIINWGGTLLVATLKTWWVIQGGTNPQPVPTRSQHGMVASFGWTQAEGAIWYRAADGLRAFTGSEGEYMSLPVEWVFQGNPQCIPPQADQTQIANDLLGFFNNKVYDSYISLNGPRYRMSWDTIYKRYRYDDVPATAMLWEQDINTFLAGKQIAPGFYAVVQDQVGDYDDGGWPVYYPVPVCSSSGWTNPQNAISTTQFATINLATAPSFILNCAISGLNIPSGATITGINVFFDAAAILTNPTTIVTNLQFGSTTSIFIANPLTSATQRFLIFADSAGWGVTLTPALLNAGFSVVFQPSGSLTGTVQLNSLTVIVTAINAGNPIQVPINLALQTPYRDLKSPNNPKQWNMFETDVNSQGQPVTNNLLFEDGTINLPLANVTTINRQKVPLMVNPPNAPEGSGQQAYRASIRHTMAVTVAPIFYQEDIYAAVLADFNNSMDTYWLKFGTDDSKFIKQGYFDYTATAPITVNLYADNINTPYFTFTLPIQNQRYVQRVRFGNINSTIFTMRAWRLIAVCNGQFQWWANPRIEWKRIGAGSSYQVQEITN